jgi:ATPase family associated with various cellular activities (AAA)/Winged helix domain, variant
MTTMVEWIEQNRRVLFAELGDVRRLLERKPAEPADTDAARAALSAPAAIDILGDAFGLSPFERRVVLLCAGVELQAELGDLCAGAAGDARAPYPTLRLALSVFPDAHFSAASASAPLRRYRLVELLSGDDLLHARLRLDERVLHHLLGVMSLDVRLHGLVEAVAIGDGTEAVASHAEATSRLVALWSRPLAGGRRPVAQLCGPDPAGKVQMVADACRRCNLALHSVRAADLPHGALERDLIATLWEREAALGASVLLVEHDDHDPPDATRAAVAFLERVGGLVVVATRDAFPLRRRTAMRIDVEVLSPEDQHSLWCRLLGAHADEINGELTPVIAQFRLGLAGLRAAAAEVLDRASTGDEAPLGRLAWRACRLHARPRLDDLAQRIEARANWDDLVLPQSKVRLLHEIAAHVRHAVTVYERWGFASRHARGLGIAALFAGASGTGKTMAAEVLAGELELDLYRIDLSQVVSKYIGETEKNLRRIFDAAEEGGALLLFDEADALFGKRSEVKDSHDRYANLEISYLLQRMEQYRGLAVLTTNMRTALDHAFMRRLRFVVEFPFPDAEQRAELWRRVFPPRTPLNNLDMERLSRLNISGGVIRSIALNAAFLAADKGEPVSMHHLNHAAHDEYTKLERPYDGELA